MRLPLPRPLARLRIRLSEAVLGHRLVPASVAVLALAGTLWLWQALAAHDEAVVQRSVASRAHELRTSTLDRIRTRHAMLERIAERWARVGAPADWSFDGAQAIEIGRLSAVLFVDTALVVLHAATDDTAVRVPAALPVDDERLQAVTNARRSGTISFSNGVELLSGEFGFASVVPVVRGGALLGFVVGENPVARVIAESRVTSDEASYSVAVFAGGREVFARDPDGRAEEARWAHDIAIGGRGSTWRLRVWPTAAELERQRSRLPHLVLPIGVFVALLLAWTVRTAQTARLRARELCRANRRLEGEMAERVRAERALRVSEEHLRHAQKMEAVGRLAGGIAHDFNNMLTAIDGYSDFLLEDLDGSDPRRDDVSEIKKAARRASALTSQLLAFSRRQIRQPKAVDLNALIADVERMLRRLVAEDVALETRFGASLGTVWADPGQLEQVVMNLVVNAGDATPSGGGITIATENVELGPDAARAAGLAPGRYVALRVRDTGQGMTPEVVARIFEPFFTTKERGRGTGLGLSTVYAIVEASDGAVVVESIPGRGTTFTVFLPRQDVPAEGTHSGSGVAVPPGGHETVLLAEDEDGVRALARRILERAGYTVLAARDGREALAVAADHEGPIHLLLTDVVMPVMGGRPLADALRPARPEMRVLFVSGYTDGEISRRGELDPDTAFLQKPFAAPALLGRVRELLDAEAVAL